MTSLTGNMGPIVNGEASYNRMTMFPTRRPGATAPGLHLKLVLAFYVMASALLPLAHHDIVCHLKSSTHCTTCIVGSSAESVAQVAVFGAFTLKDAGDASTSGTAHVESALRTARSGRAPPVA
jgi:hypothetical protein